MQCRQWLCVGRRCWRLWRWRWRCSIDWLKIQDPQYQLRVSVCRSLFLCACKQHKKHSSEYLCDEIQNECLYSESNLNGLLDSRRSLVYRYYCCKNIYSTTRRSRTPAAHIKHQCNLKHFNLSVFVCVSVLNCNICCEIWRQGVSAWGGVQRWWRESASKFDQSLETHAL